MSGNDETLSVLVRKALAHDQDLARRILKELGDRDDLIERVEDAVAEKIELSGSLAEAKARLAELEQSVARLGELERRCRTLEEERNRYAEEVQRLRVNSGVPGDGSQVGDDELREELERLRRVRRELEQELEMRDEVLASLRSELRRGGSGSGDGDYAALLEEKNNLAEQLTLALSQLEEVTDRDGLVDKLDRKTREAFELEEQLRQALAENNSLRAGTAELEERLKSLESKRSEVPEDRGHNPALVWIVGIMLFAGIYFGAGRFRSDTGTAGQNGGTAAPSSASARKPVELSVLEAAARQRLYRQKSSLGALLASVAQERGVTADDLADAIDRSLAGEDPYRRALASIVKGDFAGAMPGLQADEERRKLSFGFLYYLMGRCSFFAGRIGESRRYLKAAVERDYTLTDAWRALGDLELLEEHTEQAMHAYREALKIDPKDARALSAIGAILSLDDRLDEAIDAYRKAIAADPGLAETHCALGMIYQRKEDWGRAAECLEEAVMLEPDNARAHWFLSRCYEVLGKKDKARLHRERALSLGYSELDGASVGVSAASSAPATCPAPVRKAGAR